MSRSSRYTDKKCDLCENAIIQTIFANIKGEEVWSEVYPLGVYQVIVKRRNSLFNFWGKKNKPTREEKFNMCGPCGKSFSEWATSRHHETCYCGRDSCAGTQKRKSEREIANVFGNYIKFAG